MQSRTIRTAAVQMLALALLAPALSNAKKFYDDDPLLREPQPRHVEDARHRKLSNYYDFVRNMFINPGEWQELAGRLIPARNVNTLDEPMAGAWWEPRHYYKRMTIDELKAGAGAAHPPAQGPWTVIAAKAEGVTPGFTIRDSAGEVFILKFDPFVYPELSTGADMVSSRIFHAAGYHVPEYYIVHFESERLQLADDVQFRDDQGKVRTMKRKDVTELLLDAPQDARGRWRGLTSRLLPGKPLGPFRFDGVRSDDPNDTVPHEHNRVLRGYRALCAFLNHDDSRALNTLDMLQTRPDGLQHVKHYLIDFGSTLGSGTYRPNSSRNGAEYLWEAGPAAKQFFSLGIWLPDWARKDFKPGSRYRGVGHWESEVFDPEGWKPEYPNPAFRNANPDDLFWGAKQVMAFTDEELRAIVAVGEYSDPKAAEYIHKHLVIRRDKIGRAFFSGVLPLDRFRIENGELVFEDLELKYGFVHSRAHAIEWARFDNETERKTPIPGAASTTLPEIPPSGYVAALITAENPEKTVTVYVRNRDGKLEIVGIERSFPEPAFPRQTAKN